MLLGLTQICPDRQTLYAERALRHKSWTRGPTYLTMTQFAFRQTSAFMLALAVLASPVAAASQQRTGQPPKKIDAVEIGRAGSVGILRIGKGKSKTCLVVAQPAERLPKALTRDPAYVYVVMKQGEPQKLEFQVHTGYTLKPGAEAQITAGSQLFLASGSEQTLWLKNPSEEPRLISELRRATTMTIKGTSLRGNDTTDRYSVTGFGQALEQAQKECS
jgi:hypothetical protein